MKITYMKNLPTRSGLVIGPWELEDGEIAKVVEWDGTPYNVHVQRRGDALYTTSESKPDVYVRNWRMDVVHDWQRRYTGKLLVEIQ
jgi:hypothetical protein